MFQALNIVTTFSGQQWKPSKHVCSWCLAILYQVNTERKSLFAFRWQDKCTRYLASCRLKRMLVFIPDQHLALQPCSDSIERFTLRLFVKLYWSNFDHFKRTAFNNSSCTSKFSWPESVKLGQFFVQITAILEPWWWECRNETGIKPPIL